jgi:hypothetical protein
MARLRYALCALVLSMPVATLAQEQVQAEPPRFDYRIDAGIEHNDNVNLSEDDPKVDNILAPTLGFTYRQGGSVVQAEIDGALQYRDYLNDTFGDELRGQIGGRVNWIILPQRLDFVFEDYLGMQPIDSLEPGAPSNLQQTNVFALGPTFDFRLGAAARGQVELRYIDSYAEKTDAFDSGREVGAFRIVRDVSATSQLSGNVEAQHIDFKHDSGGPGYDRYNLFGRYAQTLRVFDYTIDLGYTWLDAGDPVGSHSAPLARLVAGWHPDERSRLAFIGSYQYSDAATDLIETVQERVMPRAGQSIPTSIAAGTAVVNPAPYRETRAQLTYSYVEKRWSLNVAPYYSKYDYFDSPADPFGGASSQIARGVDIAVGWNFTPQLALQALAGGYDVEYPGLDRTDHNWTYGLFLTQILTPHWSWRAGVSHYERDSTVSGQDADQNILLASVAYTR